MANLSPLRRIVSRELLTYQPDSRNPKYLIYSLLDRMECGHSKGVYLWNGLLDVLNAYTDNPEMRSRRHRCRPCSAVLVKKPVQSVGIREAAFKICEKAGKALRNPKRA